MPGDRITILHVIGLPGAGKTTLTSRLGPALGWPVTTIGEHRRDQPPTFQGEMDAWHSLYTMLSERGWQQTIVETSGLNARSTLLAPSPAARRVMVIKLACAPDVLHERVRAREAANVEEDEDEAGEGGREDEEQRPWAFQAALPNRHVFIDRFHEAFQEVPATL